MSTTSMIYLRVRPEDFGRTITCNVKSLPVELRENIYPCRPFTIPAKPHNNDLIIGVYCHWDGYPSGVGATLQKYYPNYEDVLNLIALGDLSCCADTHIVSYNNWRDENTKITKVEGGNEPHREEYNYLFENGMWQRF